MNLRNRIEKLENLLNSKSNIYSKLSDLQIPEDPQKFYEDVGLIPHPTRRNLDGSPELVKNLAGYQTQIWSDGFKYKYRLTIKSQKIGISTSSLMEDFQYAILPRDNPLSCRGFEILIIGQTFHKAKEHLRDLKHWVLRSSKYKDFIITKPETSESKDEQSKVTELYIRNPDDPSNPTRIIALGMLSEASIWSWKKVKFIHMSDVAATELIDDAPLFAASLSRLANTAGRLHIETPPHGQRGKVWEIYQRSKIGSDKLSPESVFKINEIPAREAVQAGVITQEFLDEQKIEQGILYSQMFECDFLSSSNTYYRPELFQYDDDLIMGEGSNEV